MRDLGGKANENEPMKNQAPASVEYRQIAEAAAESMVSLCLNQALSIDLYCIRFGAM